jgi:hypothetical protein
MRTTAQAATGLMRGHNLAGRLSGRYRPIHRAQHFSHCCKHPWDTRVVMLSSTACDSACISATSLNFSPFNRIFILQLLTTLETKFLYIFFYLILQVLAQRKSVLFLVVPQHARLQQSASCLNHPVKMGRHVYLE